MKIVKFLLILLIPVMIILIIGLMSFTFFPPGSIGDIMEYPEKYEGKRITIAGEYRGWEGGYGSPPVTRSDWIIKDETGGIYVTGVLPELNPAEDIGTKVEVTGIVMVKNGQVYIKRMGVGIKKPKE